MAEQTGANDPGVDPSGQASDHPEPNESEDSEIIQAEENRLAGEIRASWEDPILKPTRDQMLATIPGSTLAERAHNRDRIDFAPQIEKAVAGGALKGFKERSTPFTEIKEGENKPWLSAVMRARKDILGDEGTVQPGQDYAIYTEGSIPGAEMLDLVDDGAELLPLEDLREVEQAVAALMEFGVYKLAKYGTDAPLRQSIEVMRQLAGVDPEFDLNSAGLSEAVSLVANASVATTLDLENHPNYEYAKPELSTRKRHYNGALDAMSEVIAHQQVSAYIKGWGSEQHPDESGNPTE